MSKSKSISKTLYRKIFLFIIITIISTVVLLSCSLYFSFENAGLSLIHSYIKDSLSQLSYSSNFMADTAKTTCVQIFYTPDNSSLLHYSNTNETDAHVILNNLNYYRFSSEYIYSIYLYNAANRNFYTVAPMGSGKYEASALPDKNIIEIFRDKKGVDTIYPIPRKIPEFGLNLSDSRLIDVYTFIYNDLPEKINEKESYVIVNLSVEWMRKILVSMDSNSDTDTFIIDSKGSVVLDSSSHKFLEDISQEYYISKILNSPDKSGYYIDKVNGTNSLITYVSSNQLDWKFIRITPYSKISEKINKIKYVTIFIVVLVLLLGLCLALFVSRIFKKPIDSITSKLISLESEKRSSSQSLKNEFLKKLLTNKDISEQDSLNAKFNSLCIEFNPQCEYICVLFKIDNYSAFCNEYMTTDRDLLKFAQANIISEIFKNNFPKVEVIDMGEDKIAVIANIDSSLGLTIQTKLTSVINEIQEYTEYYLHLSLSASVSSIDNSNDDIYTAYNKAVILSHYRLIKGHKCIIYSDSIAEKTFDEKDYPLQKERTLLISLMLGKVDEVKEQYDKMIQIASSYSYSAIHKTFMQLAFAIQKVIHGLEQSGGVVIPFDFYGFISQISCFETLDEVNQHFYALFEEIASKKEESKSPKYNELLSQIEKIIRDEYSSQNLSPDAIADRLVMSPEYLRRLFKKLSSKSIVDYINEYRLEKAKELLISTGLSTSEIAEKIGLNSRTYFFTMFKKYHGITPSQYRENSHKSIDP